MTSKDSEGAIEGPGHGRGRARPPRDADRRAVDRPRGARLHVVGRLDPPARVGRPRDPLGAARPCGTSAPARRSSGTSPTSPRRTPGSTSGTPCGRWARMAYDPDDGTISARTGAFLYAGVDPWLETFLLMAVGLQASLAWLGAETAEGVGPRDDEPHPVAGPRRDPDDMLNLAGSTPKVPSPITASILRSAAADARGRGLRGDVRRGRRDPGRDPADIRGRGLDVDAADRGPPGPRAGCAGAPGPAAADGGAPGAPGSRTRSTSPRRPTGRARTGRTHSGRGPSMTAGWPTTRSSRRCCWAAATRTPRSWPPATSRPGAASGPGSPGSGCPWLEAAAVVPVPRRRARRRRADGDSDR